MIITQPCIYLTSAIDEDSSSLIETRVEVSLKGSNVLGQMNKLVQVCPNINEAWKDIIVNVYIHVYTCMCVMHASVQPCIHVHVSVQLGLSLYIIITSMKFDTVAIDRIIIIVSVGHKI